MSHFLSEGKKDSDFETPLKTFQILCQEKNKDPLWRPCPLDGRISAVKRESPAILHLLNRPVCHIFAIHEAIMI
jgi:hypothetical protein